MNIKMSVIGIMVSSSTLSHGLLTKILSRVKGSVTNNNGLVLNLLAPLLQLHLITMT
jgi:hypothetical protein